MISITIFAVSFAGCTGLLVSGYVNIRKRAKNPLSRLISRLDIKIESARIKLYGVYIQVLQSVRYLFKVLIPFAINKLVEHIKEEVRKEYNKRSDIIHGKRDIANKGAVSFYLRKISRDKDDFGEIE